MFLPHPEPFAGSTPHDHTPANPLPRQIELALAGIAVCTGVAAALGAMAAPGAAWPAAVKLAAVAMLVPALIGIWLMEAAAEAPSQTVTRLWSRIAERVAMAPGQAVHGSIREDALDGFAGLLGGMLLKLKRLQVAGTQARLSAEAANAALQAARDHAAGCAFQLRDDGAAATVAASDIMAASASLAASAQETSTGAEAAEESVASMTDQAVSLAGSVRIVTQQISRMTEIAASAAGAALGAQTHLSGLDGRARDFGASASQVGRALQMAASCGRAAGDQASADSPVAADLAANLMEMACCADQALGTMQGAVNGVLADAASATRRLAELSALIESQHELGLALSRAVSQQGEDISQVLGLLNEAHAGFGLLRAGVAAISASNNARLASAETLRGAVHRIPAHADTIAHILRGIPDFAPPLEY